MRNIPTTNPVVNKNTPHSTSQDTLTTDEAAAVIVAAFGQSVLERLRAYRVQNDTRANR